MKLEWSRLDEPGLPGKTYVAIPDELIGGVQWVFIVSQPGGLGWNAGALRMDTMKTEHTTSGHPTAERAATAVLDAVRYCVIEW